MKIPQINWWVVARVVCLAYCAMVLVGFAIMWWHHGMTFYSALDLLPPFVVFVFSIAVFAAMDNSARKGELFAEIVQGDEIPPMLRPAQYRGRAGHPLPFVRAVVQDAAGWLIVELPEDWRRFDLADSIAWSRVLAAEGGLGFPSHTARPESLYCGGSDLAFHSARRAVDAGAR